MAPSVPFQDRLALIGVLLTPTLRDDTPGPVLSAGDVLVSDEDEVLQTAIGHHVLVDGNVLFSRRVVFNLGRFW